MACQFCAQFALDRCPDCGASTLNPVAKLEYDLQSFRFWQLQNELNDLLAKQRVALGVDLMAALREAKP